MTGEEGSFVTVIKHKKVDFANRCNESGIVDIAARKIVQPSTRHQ